MKNVDKDIADMLTSLKKYDMLAESVAPVLERRKPVAEEAEADEKDDADVSGEKDDADDESSPDQEVMEWMERFKKLGR